MKFTKIRLIGLSMVDLPVADAMPSDPYILKSADGLGPPEVDVTIAGTLNAGGFYQGRRPQSRQLIFQIGLNPDYGSGQTASDLRQTLYGMLTPGYKDNVIVQVMDGDTVLMVTTAYVKTTEVAAFSKDPEIQLTMDCLEQYFSAPNLNFITPADKTHPVIHNDGSAPAGIHMEVVFTGPLSSWTLSDATGKKMQFTYDFINGDRLIFDTRPGSRGIWRVRSGVTLNIIYSLSSDSDWYMLFGGDNTFTTSSQAFNWGDTYYLPQYWGI